MDSTLPVVLMTAWGSIELAVEAMRRGARDFVQKPWDNARLLAILRTQIELGRALRRGERLEAENEILRGEGQPRMIAESPAMRPVLADDRARGALRRQRADHRRERHGQGPGRAGAARGFPARGPAVRHGQHRRPDGNAV